MTSPPTDISQAWHSSPVLRRGFVSIAVVLMGAALWSCSHRLTASYRASHHRGTQGTFELRYRDITSRSRSGRSTWAWFGDFTGDDGRLVTSIQIEPLPGDDESKEGAGKWERGAKVAAQWEAATPRSAYLRDSNEFRHWVWVAIGVTGFAAVGIGGLVLSSRRARSSSDPATEDASPQGP